ncbi:hypothetical protein AOLI_G00146390 [Acnodon oligacanthus]
MTKEEEKNMAQETKQTQAPLLCAMGCGFYGNPRTNGMCSVCYRDFLQRQNGSGKVSDPVSECFSALGESLLTQSATVTPALEQSSQSLITPAVEAQESKTSAEAQEEVKTEEVAEVAGASTSTAVASVQKNVSIDELLRSAGSVEDGARRGKRKLSEILQLDEDGASGSDVSVQSSTTEVDKSKPKKNRCFTCRKKVGLTGFDCRCGNLFCGVHRYSDAHNCSFDYKAEAAQKIRKENPVVVGEKIKKI